MTSGKDWIIILRQAAPPELCTSAVEQVMSGPQLNQQEGFSLFRPQDICAEIADAAHKRYGETIASHFRTEVGAVYNYSVKPIRISAGNFTKLDQAAASGGGKEHEIYLIIALSPLSKASGLFAFALQGAEGEPVKPTVPDLVPGDAVAWTRKNLGRDAVGEGGVFQVVIYR